MYGTDFAIKKKAGKQKPAFFFLNFSALKEGKIQFV